MIDHYALMPLEYVLLAGTESAGVRSTTRRVLRSGRLGGRKHVTVARIIGVLKAAALPVILLFGLWALWPASGDDVVTLGPRDYGPEVKYVLKVAPGPMYMPGVEPFGIGKPLRGLADVIRAFEARFPDTRVECITVPVMRREFLITQLSSGQAPDIINVNVEDVWMDIQKGWYVPLDHWLEQPNPFVVEKGDPTAPGAVQWWDMFEYQAISRGKAAPDNLNYCVSFDMIETGIYYNKDVFRKVGVDVPEDWEGFLEIMGKLRAAGYIPLLMIVGLFNDWATDLIFDQLYYEVLPGIDLVQDPTREGYLEGYLDWDEIAFLYEKGFFTPRDARYREVFRIMKDLRRYANKNLTGIDMLREFVTQQGAMLWHPCNIIYRLKADKSLGFEWGVFYLPELTKRTSKYASDTPMCVIGGSAVQFEVTNTAVGDTPASLPLGERMRRSTRLERVMALLQFLCVPENYERIVNEYEALIPNIRGVTPLPALRPFVEILQRRYTTTKWTFTFDLKFSEVQQRLLDLYLNDGATLDEFMELQNENLAYATKNAVLRKRLDLERLEGKWRELAPIRATMEDLPCDD